MMAMRHRRKPDGRGPFMVEGEPYIEPSMQRYEVPTVVSRRFHPNQEIPEYNPESDLLPLGEGLSGYFEGTRTPTEVQLAREQTEQLRRRIIDAQDARQVHEQIEMAKLDIIRSASLPFGGAQGATQLASALFGGSSRITPTPGNVPEVRQQLAHDFIQLPQEQREQVLENVTKTQTVIDSSGRRLQEIHPQPYRRPAARSYVRRAPQK